jgi:HD-GYP domain-containing protein (c-di-GMP phosphodiesterase class II)
MKTHSDFCRDGLHLLRRHVDFTVRYAASPLDVTVAAAVEMLREWTQSDYACLHFMGVDELDDVVRQAGVHRCAGRLVGKGFEEQLIREVAQTDGALAQRERGGPFSAVRAWPLRFCRTTFGVLNAYYAQPPRELDHDVLDALQQLAYFIYAGIQRRIVERDGAEYAMIVGLLGSVLEQKDGATAGHCDRVLHYAERLAIALGVAGDELRVVRPAALLHDIGKVGVPEYILNKPAKLSDEEFAIVREHAKRGQELIARLPGAHMAAVAQAIGAHHEWYDGSGYPGGLAREGIPRAARIISICDAYDVMTAGRCYRPKSDARDAVKELLRAAGSQFDPSLVLAFMRGRDFDIGANLQERHAGLS